MKLDFEQYATEKAMKGTIAESWIKPFKQYFLDLCGSFQNVRILDYGFGDGRYFEYFTQYFDRQNIHGVEISKIRVERAQARGWQKAIYLDMLAKFPYEDSFFDLINMVEVIEHIPPQDVSFYLSELQRVIKQEGVLILTTPNYPIKRVYDILDAFRLSKWSRLRDDSTHAAFYNHKSLRSLLTQYFESIWFYSYKEGLLYRQWKADFFCHKILVVCSRARK
jgi:SAM-dependent methyltransferase